MDLTQSNLNSVFFYKEGKLFDSENTRVGYLNQYTGYRRISIKGNSYKEHRIIFFMIHGYLPKVVHHINHLRDDNRIENLAPCDYYENNRNQPKRQNCKSKYKGVYFDKTGKRVKRWRARIWFQEKRISLGYFLTEEEAGLAYNAAAEKLFGDFAILNEIEIENVRGRER